VASASGFCVVLAYGLAYGIGYSIKFGIT